jgi:hypothetical protein
MDWQRRPHHIATLFSCLFGGGGEYIKMPPSSTTAHHLAGTSWEDRSCCCNETHYAYGCDVNGKFGRRTGHEGPEGEQSYSSTLFLTSALDGGGWVVNGTPRALYTRGRDPVPIVCEAGWVLGPAWTGTKSLAPSTGIRSSDRPARSESLFRLRHPGPQMWGLN